MAYISFSHITKEYGTGEAKVHALADRVIRFNSSRAIEMTKNSHSKPISEIEW